MDENRQPPHILYSCYTQKSREGEQFIPNHVFSYTLAGTSEVHVGGKTYIFKEGDYRFFRKNQLSKYIKYPPPGGLYKSISVAIDEATLRSMSEEHNLHTQHHSNIEGAIRLQPNALLKNYIDSLTPYIDGISDISKILTTLKVKEIVLLLLQTNPVLKDILFDFSEPGKIDLEAYMNEHYKFNVELSRFAYLTGRSLATFKRDFEKIYHAPPNKWLQQKRLHDAYYLLTEKGAKVTDVYLDVGFKDLSHFSFAFKKAYGVGPSMVG